MGAACCSCTTQDKSSKLKNNFAYPGDIPYRSGEK